ncbi:MAG: Crp/Fnr family transcriptional regulator [Bacteroidia bacterium]|nr:Crp/Fnr family transcriptional regulator [Bacteroidia bacterium]
MTELEVYISSYFGAPTDAVGKLSTLFVEEELKRDDIHTRTGSYHGRLSFVRSGYLRIYKQTELKEVTQWISSPGEFTADLNAIMFNQPARWTIQALTDCQLYTIHQEDYKKIGTLIPEWTNLERLFLGKCFITLEERVFSFLSLTAEERYKLFFEERKELFNLVSLQYIASMLGMTPETFSRIRKKMSS